MSSIEEVMNRIAVANAESKRLNAERNINVGKKDTLTKQFNDAVAKYKLDYSVDLNLDNLNSEIERVIKLKEDEVTKIETVLNLIQAGKYAEADSMVNGVSETASVQEATPAPEVETPIAEASTPEPVAPPVNTTGIAALDGFSASLEEIQSAQAVESPTQTVEAPTSTSVDTSEPAVPVAPTAPVAPSAPTAPVTSTESVASTAPVAPSAPTVPTAPSAPSEPVAPSMPNLDNVTSFSAILGGSAFK